MIPYIKQIDFRLLKVNLGKAVTAEFLLLKGCVHEEFWSFRRAEKAACSVRWA